MNPRVLIIADQRDYRTLLRHHLTCEWPEAHIATCDPNSDSALAEDFDGSGFDVVVLDHGLVRQDAIAMLRRFKAADGFPPVVMLVDEHDDVASVSAIRAGADDCIPKGRLSNSYLVNAVKQAMARDREDTQTIETLIRSGPSRVLSGTLEVPGYESVRRLAATPASSVWVVRRESDDREMVLKVMSELPAGDEGQWRGEEFNATCASFEALDHPGVARMYDHGIHEDRPWLAMEFFPRGHLGLRLGSPVEPGVAVGYVRQLASALDVLHYCDIVHGDLKPANVMFRDDETLAIADFRIARRLTDKNELTVPGALLAAAFYTTPEQAMGRETDVRSDLYALGLIFFELLTGHKPYAAASPLAVLNKHCHGGLPPLGPGREALEPIVHGLLAKDPDDRPQTAARVLELLTACKRL